MVCISNKYNSIDKNILKNIIIIKFDSVKFLLKSNLNNNVIKIDGNNGR
jgi:hypothetical protein